MSAVSQTPSGFGIVESWNEWDTLREVWVGSLEHKNLTAPQATFSSSRNI
jgi:hypothetical protein